MDDILDRLPVLIRRKLLRRGNCSENPAYSSPATIYLELFVSWSP
jgi:hypothetical protein